ncbi:MAG: carboxypeptidase M32 [Thermoplasmatales archaeon]|nr:carboxypeptidase M32 [Thermoplasmatales archaeon]
MKDSLDFIYKEQKELSTFGGIAALLGWDQMTYMPKLGAMERSEQSALISRLIHERVISDKFWHHIQDLTTNLDILSEKDKAVIKRLEEDVEKSRKIPSEFVERMSKTTTLAYQAWEEARGKNDYNVFSPHLEKIIDLEKEYCGYINLPGHKYDSLLDDYEEGMTVDKLKHEFSFLKKELTEILEKIKSSPIYENQKEIDVKLNEEAQRKICNVIIEKMQLPKEKSRIDVSTHPFTTSMGNDDVRITTNFGRGDLLFSFFSTVHEAGHALYELNMPKDEFQNTVISDSPSLGIHESQSRFWENMIGRSKPFWNLLYPIFKEESAHLFNKVTFDEWYRYVNQVKPSMIRVEADELTYCLHVILRFELEVGLMEDKFSVNSLPQLWNEKMNEMLGITPNNDVEGVLQDMHWSGGSIGYFPTYAIGSIYSSQLFKKISQVNDKLNDEIEQGYFTNIITWLQDNIHKYGRLLTADELIKKACGEGLNSGIFVDYLKDKYYKLYEV